MTKIEVISFESSKKKDGIYYEREREKHMKTKPDFGLENCFCSTSEHMLLETLIIVNVNMWTTLVENFSSIFSSSASSMVLIGQTLWGGFDIRIAMYRNVIVKKYGSICIHVRCSDSGAILWPGDDKNTFQQWNLYGDIFRWTKYISIYDWLVGHDTEPMYSTCIFKNCWTNVNKIVMQVGIFQAIFRQMAVCLLLQCHLIGTQVAA